MRIQKIIKKLIALFFFTKIHIKKGRNYLYIIIYNDI